MKLIQRIFSAGLLVGLASMVAAGCSLGVDDGGDCNLDCADGVAQVADACRQGGGCTLDGHPAECDVQQRCVIGPGATLSIPLSALPSAKTAPDVILTFTPDPITGLEVKSGGVALPVRESGGGFHVTRQANEPASSTLDVRFDQGSMSQVSIQIEDAPCVAKRLACDDGGA